MGLFFNREPGKDPELVKPEGSDIPGPIVPGHWDPITGAMEITGADVYTFDLPGNLNDLYYWVVTIDSPPLGSGQPTPQDNVTFCMHRRGHAHGDRRGYDKRPWEVTFVWDVGDAVKVLYWQAEVWV